MERFAALLDALIFTPSRNGKLRLMAEFFRTTPDPERGWALAALTGELSFREAKGHQIRALAEARVDAELLGWSYDFVGDLAETVALVWPRRPGANRVPDLSEIVAGLTEIGRAGVPALIEGWLDALDSTGRWALLKLVTGGLRVGVSARLAKTALVQLAPARRASSEADSSEADTSEADTIRPDDIEEVWHGMAPPYLDLFDWIEGRIPRPDISDLPTFNPLMLAQPLEEEDILALDADAYRAEWKWDGIRVQLASKRGERRVYSRSGDDISNAFPDIIHAMHDDVVLDGELLVLRGAEVAPFNDLQQRLNRKVVTAKMLKEFPASVRLYDILYEAGEDLRTLSFDARRVRLERWYAAEPRPRLDLSDMVPFADWGALRAIREGTRDLGIEGLMLKRAESTYVPGRPKGQWFKWKRSALTIDAVMMYAQRGHGKRSSFYSDYTFGTWRGEELVPVGKAYSGFTDEELVKLDKWVRNNTTRRYGPVREVAPGLVLEIAFDAVQRSTRHKSGLALRFPRVFRIRWDKPYREADRVETLERLIPA